MAFPYALTAWTALGAAAAYRALVRPCRAVFEQGSIVACPGDSGCSPGLTVQSSSGVASAYSLVTGTVTQAASGVVQVASALEPVLVTYSSPGLSPVVGLGQVVKAGQSIAQAATVTLSVTALERQSTGAIKATSIEPASWLAGRGLKAAMHLAPSAAWCGQGRKLVVPQAVAQCGVVLPDPPGFALLPVSSRLQQ